MKNAVASATNTGTINVDNGEKTRVHPAAYGLIMDMLSGVYTNADEAVLREYSVNGWDEHVKHGVTRPVEVTLPSLLQPTMSIRDFGAGIPLNGTYVIDESGERICTQRGAMEVFGEYGNSSKRDNDNEVGGFGIGSKAAFAMGQQFIVDGYKDGQTFTVLFTLNEDGTGTKTVMHEGPTNEPNGVRVSLGVDDVESMRAAADKVFQYWERGTVLVDGEEPTPIFGSLEKVSDEVMLNPNGRGAAYAVMGPVAYPIDRDLLGKIARHLKKQDVEEAADMATRVLDSDTDLYLRVPIGTVKPAPSREALRDKPITIQTLASVFLGLYQDSVAKVQTEVAAAPTYYDAASRFAAANAALGAFKVSRKSVSWNGLPIRAVQPVEMANFSLQSRSWRSDSKILGATSKVSAEFPDVHNWLTVVGVPEGEQGKVQRFAKRFLQDNEQGVTRVLTTPATSVSFGWFQVGIERGARTVTLDEWRALLKSMRKASPRTVNEPSYSTGFVTAEKDPEDRDLLSDIISEGKPLVPFEGSATWLNSFERKALEGYTPVVLFGTQSKDALVRRVEADGTVQIVEWDTLRPQALAAAQAVLDTMTDEEREAAGARLWLSENRHTRSGTDSLLDSLTAAGEVTNPALLAVSESFDLAEVYAEALTEERATLLKTANRFVSGDHSLPGAVTYSDESVDTLDVDARFPLLDTNALRHAAARYRRYTNEDGEFSGENTWSYNENTWNNHKRLLAHALAYVNNN